MDEKIFHLINEQWTNPAFDLFMPLISYAEIWTPFILIAAVALLIFGGFRGRAFVFVPRSHSVFPMLRLIRLNTPSDGRARNRCKPCA